MVKKIAYSAALMLPAFSKVARITTTHTKTKQNGDVKSGGGSEAQVKGMEDQVIQAIGD